MGRIQRGIRRCGRRLNVGLVGIIIDIWDIIRTQKEKDIIIYIIAPFVEKTKNNG